MSEETQQQETQGTEAEAQAQQQEKATEKVVPLATFKKLEREAKDAAKKLADFEAAEEERRKASMSEAEKAREEAEQAKAAQENLKSEVELEKRRTLVLQAAQAVGFEKPELALRLVDMSALNSEDLAGIRAAVQAELDDNPRLSKDYEAARQVGSPSRVGVPPVGGEQAAATQRQLEGLRQRLGLIK
jgi:hypothetical protein